ncbi:ATP-dependent helicase [Nocardioides aequoreus]|uniref:ATP-dependent helicase n=1 Tax=Nocardioides aequoreus TaxID=397278 RepID=UPI0004C2D197|nr:ATP-dependent helicase [Nocardioides aequoreus]
MTNPIARDLVPSPEQAAAIASDDIAVVVVASAGSGKTEVVARRVERLLEERVDSLGRILAVTYTVKAAAELRERFRARLGNASRRVETETVHGFAHALLRQHGTHIGLPAEPELLVRDEDRAELLDRWLDDNGIEPPDDTFETLRRLDLARSTGTRCEFLEEWEQALENAGALDYPGLLSAATTLLAVKSVKRQVSRVYEQVIVDEAQNLTAAQYDLLVALASSGTNGQLNTPTMFVGDDKQSIVSFAGADPKHMLRFAEEFNAIRFDLTANFRSATAIARAAEAIAAQLGHVNPVGEFAAQGEVAVREAPDEATEAELVAGWVEGLLADGLDPDILAPDEGATVEPEQIAILARAGSALRSVNAALGQRGVELVSASTSGEWLASASGRIAMEVVALRTSEDHKSTHWQLSRLLDVPEDDVSTIGQLQEVLRAHTDPSAAALAEVAGVERVSDFTAALTAVDLPESVPPEELSAWESDLSLLAEAWSRFDAETDRAAVTWGNFKLFCAKQQRGDDLAPGVRLLTIHKAQGREFLAVAVVGLNDGQLPDFRATSEEDLTAELRTFYVAISRARRSLLLTRPQSRMTRYGSRASSPSRYLALIR